MSEMEKLLEEKMDEYESARRQAMKFVHENQKELSKNYAYAEELTEPLTENQIFFCLENRTKGGELVRKILETVVHRYGNEYICICCAKGGFFLFGPSGKIQMIKEESEEYWTALATSRYIISSIPLPVPYVKRKGQVYFNAMAEVYDQENLENVSFLSVTARELLKTDFIYAPSYQTAAKTWLKNCKLGQVYDGRVLVPADKERAGSTLAEFLIKEHKGEELEIFSLRENPEKKKVLILGSWKAEREAKITVERILENLDSSRYDAALYTGWLSEDKERREFLSLARDIPLLMGAGRMTLKEADFLNYRTIEKNPVVYLENVRIRSYIDEMIEREWGRLFGTASWDVVFLAGSVGYLPYYLAAKAPAKTKVLADLDFLPYIKEKYPARWRRALTVFDRIYAPAGCLQLGSYGTENRLRTMRLPVLPAEKETETERVFYNRNTYLVCEKWKMKNGRTSLRLVQLPEEGSILVNGDLPFSQEQKEKLMALSKDHRLYILGAESKACHSALPDAIVLDEYVRNGLSLHPAAWEFFSAFSGYVGNQALEYDVTGKICRAFGVQMI